MLFGGGLVGLVVIGLWIYCLYDVITTEESLVRNLPKFAWLLIVLLLFDIGAILWLVAGRPQSWQVGSPQPRRYAQPHRETVLDDPRVADLHPVVRDREERARLRMWEEQLRRREAEIKRLESGLPAVEDEGPADAEQ